MKKKKEIKNLALTEEEIATNHIVKSNKTYLIVFGIFFLTIILLLVGSLFRTNITPDYPLVFRDANNKLMVITKSGSGKKDITTITDANIVYANKDIRYLLYSHNNSLFLLDTTSGGEGKKLAEDITKYFAESEQVPSAVALGVLVDTDQHVKQAGGYIVQLMPGATDEDITRLENNIAKAGAMTTMLESGMSLEDIAHAVLDGFEVEFLEEAPVTYRCGCNHAKVTRALISLGKDELTRMRDEEEGIEVTCQFCDKVYKMTRDDIAVMLEAATAKEENNG